MKKTKKADEERWTEASKLFEGESLSLLEGSIPDSFFDSDFSIDYESIEKQSIGVLGPNASYEQRFKYNLCKVVRDFTIDHKLSVSQLKELVNLSPMKIELLVRLRIDCFSFDELYLISQRIIAYEENEKKPK